MSDTSVVEPDLFNSVRADMGLELGEEYSEVIAELADEVVRFSGIRAQSDTRSKIQRVLRILIGNLVRAHQSNPDCFVAISMSSGYYSEGTYFPNAVGYRIVRRTIDFLRHPDE